MKCIVCSGELTEEEPGKISGEIIGSASGNPNQKYEKPKVQAYHDKCEREAHKLIWGEDKKRYRRMIDIMDIRIENAERRAMELEEE